MSSNIELLNMQCRVSEIRKHVHKRCDKTELELLRMLTELLHGEKPSEDVISSLVSNDIFNYTELTKLEKRRLNALSDHLPADGPVKDLHYYVLGIEDDVRVANDARNNLKEQMLSLDLTIRGGEEDIFSSFYRSYA